MDASLLLQPRLDSSFCIGPGKAIHENICASKEFGISLASQQQAALASIAGNSSGREVDKIREYWKSLVTGSIRRKRSIH
jgi:flavin reductase (DIM6/NTAB) family NADH-FMN oxidoreductase RutF